MKTSNRIFSARNGRTIELSHSSADPCVWIVRNSKKILWFRTDLSTIWFMDEQQALQFAEKQAGI